MPSNAALQRADHEPAVSVAVLQRLQEQTGDEDGELLRELAEVFLSDARDSCALFKEHLSTDNFEQYSREAHRIKSGAANLGATHLTELCQAMETQGHNHTAGDKRPLEQLLAEFEAELAAVDTALNAYIASL